MLLAPFLHIYQPPTQFNQVLKKIIRESYLKIIEILKRNQQAKLTLNIPVSLTEQLAKNYPKVITELKKLAQFGQIEFTGTAAYHPLLSKIPKTEAVRQIKLNSVINKKYFGKVFDPVGFFPPEMAYSPAVGDVIEAAGFSWVILEEFAHPGKYILRDRLFKRKNGRLWVFFRERDLSLKIAFAQINTIAKLEKYLSRELKKDGYLVTAMDGETFGHHRKGLEKFLAQLYKFKKLPTITISEILSKFTQVETVEPIHSTWGISEADCKAGRVYPRWDLPENPIHQLQWKLTNLAIDSAGKSKKAKTRHLLDKALHSDQYWWASHNPYWHYKMVVKGANMLKDAIVNSKTSKKNIQKAKELKDQIAKLGLQLYGDTVID